MILVAGCIFIHGLTLDGVIGSIRRKIAEEPAVAATSRKSIEKEDLEELQVEDKQKIKTLAIAAKKS